MAVGFVQFRSNFWRQFIRILVYFFRRGRCFAGDPPVLPAGGGGVLEFPPILGANGGRNCLVLIELSAPIYLNFGPFLPLEPVFPVGGILEFPPF